MATTPSEARFRNGWIQPASTRPVALSRPLFGARVPAGFPSPAEDYIERELDIARLLITNPPATYFAQIGGASLSGCWIRSGDIAVVDSSIDAKAGMIIVAALDGELVAKELGYGSQGEVLLIPRNKSYKTITVREGQEFQVWGVVTWTIHRQLP